MIRRLLIRVGQVRQVLSVSLNSRGVAASTSPSSTASISILNGGSFPSSRTMSSAGNRDLFYDDIVTLSSKKEIILIDVREPAEIQETGVIPEGTHIPLGDIPNALNMDAAAFKSKYGIEKPGLDAPIVFSCRSGKRSNTALEKALALGYSNSRHYAGGWLDWEKHTKQ